MTEFIHKGSLIQRKYPSYNYQVRLYFLIKCKEFERDCQEIQLCCVQILPKQLEMSPSVEQSFKYKRPVGDLLFLFKIVKFGNKINIFCFIKHLAVCNLINYFTK